MRRTQFLLLPAIVIAFVLGGRLLVADPEAVLVVWHDCKQCGQRCECTLEKHCGCIEVVANREGETPGGDAE